MFHIGVVTATPVSKEEVRLAVIELGYKRASEKLGINYATIRQWAKRGKWNVTRSHAQQTVTAVTKPSEAVLDELAEHERETRLSLAKSARRMAKDCEELPVREAEKALTVAKTMAIVHRQDEGKGQSFSLNVLNMGDLAVQVNEGEV